MKHFFLATALAVGLALASPASIALADSGGGSWSGWSSLVSWWNSFKANFFSGSHGWSGGGSGSGATAAPELDPSVAGSAIILVVGGVAYIASRRREQEVE